MKWLREPLVQFIALGTVAFLLFTIFGDSAPRDVDRVVITESQVELLLESFGRTWQRPPTADELTGLVDGFVREEIYYREALAMGLDREDTVVRRRMSQKLELLTDDLSSMVEPSDTELTAYLEEHREAFREPARLSFDQIYLSSDARGASIERDAEDLLARLRAGDQNVDAAAFGDPIMLPSFVGMASEPAIDRRFGTGFSDQLTGLDLGSWEGPVRSGFGLHLVRVNERHERQDPSLEAVRDAVVREWRAARRAQVSDAFYAGLRERYAVEVRWPEDAGETAGQSNETDG